MPSATKTGVAMPEIVLCANDHCNVLLFENQHHCPTCSVKGQPLYAENASVAQLGRAIYRKAG